MVHKSSGKRLQISAEIEQVQRGPSRGLQLATQVDYICIGIWMRVGPVIRFHMISVSLDRDTPSASKMESSI